ncbi:sugar kinase [Streptomyces sp. NBS 14/10]|uniref:sugar kinase n=1 Tax=Streptomyces sp. NBS 14/10 TaxID=1945643 RepID=UPI000B7FD4D7|nr:sugar kinase [Streptomyces sp. NBS 14/10]KAK1181784.1 sugar kinase [Streptomyces sp. NBS 14/10]NUP37553.1 sugar kinase [Streptomyces sp.]NUS89066.1 sugar kinase [Streptomyces sp.]
MSADLHADVADVVCLGESMVTFAPSSPGRLADVPAFSRGIGGAESNVACSLARVGHTARWISRVGADGFGDHLVAEIAAAGVDVSYVRRDPDRPTGIYFRTAGEREGEEREREGAGQPLSEVVYYRAGSAASAMSPRLVPRERAWSGRVLHLTGITAALSDDCHTLMRELTARAPGRPLLSFDVNYRTALWRGRDSRLLLDLARGCDLVFVGEDEAVAAWGLRGADAVRAALPEPAVLVVKQGSAGATAYARQPDGGDAVTFEPALDVDVVASVGAGDAFAAGFLSGTLRGLSVAARLRHGHLMAAAALTVPGDLGTPPSRERADGLVALDAGAWGTLRFGPGWTDTGTPGTVRAEVPHP